MTILTFASAEKNLLENGFKCITLDRHVSVFETENKIAYLYYLGLGNGFEVSEYEK